MLRGRSVNFGAVSPGASVFYLWESVAVVWAGWLGGLCDSAVKSVIYEMVSFGRNRIYDKNYLPRDFTLTGRSSIHKILRVLK